MSQQCATATAHPNVALIKYWGKRAGSGNLPAVDSLSITLGALQTRSRVCFDQAFVRDQLTINGSEVEAEQGRLAACLDALRQLAGTTQYASIDSHNDFPTAAGLASSASGYAALVVAAAAALGLDPRDTRLASIARIGSGSAPRSLFGGFSLLRNRGDDTHCEPLLNASEWPLQVVVAVTTEKAKPITSRHGMRQSRLTSPYYQAWLDSHAADLKQATDAVLARDFSALAEVSEHSCLKMHAVMMTTRPPLMYWSPATLACIELIQSLRRDGLAVFFTVDAGPQVKAVCLPECVETVKTTLAEVPGVLRLIVGGLGAEPSLIRENA